MADRCPYCGRETGEAHSRDAKRAERVDEGITLKRAGADSRDGSKARGREGFRGRLDGGDRARGSLGFKQLLLLGKFLMDRGVQPWKKLLLTGAALYVVSPIDLFPDFPVFGWVDDLVVVGLVWQWLTTELERYRNRL